MNRYEKASTFVLALFGFMYAENSILRIFLPDHGEQLTVSVFLQLLLAQASILSVLAIWAITLKSVSAVFIYASLAGMFIGAICDILQPDLNGNLLNMSGIGFVFGLLAWAYWRYNRFKLS